MICRVCDHPFVYGDEIVRVYKWDKGHKPSTFDEVEQAYIGGSTADDYPINFIHLKCVLDKVGQSR